MANVSYKNVYIIDMNKVVNNPMQWMILGGALPVAKKNGLDNPDVKLLSERLVKKMINKYNFLSEAMGVKNASTIIEYIDTTGTAVITLYPTNDIEVHKTDWTNLPQVAIDEIHRIQNKRAALLNNLQNNITKK